MEEPESADSAVLRTAVDTARMKAQMLLSLGLLMVVCFTSFAQKQPIQQPAGSLMAQRQAALDRLHAAEAAAHPMLRQWKKTKAELHQAYEVGRGPLMNFYGEYSRAAADPKAVDELFEHL